MYFVVKALIAFFETFQGQLKRNWLNIFCYKKIFMIIRLNKSPINPQRRFLASNKKVTVSNRFEYKDFLSSINSGY